MNPQRLVESLEILQTQLSGILDLSRADRALGKARSEIRTMHDLYSRYYNRSDVQHPILDEGWGFSIRNPPLCFRQMTIKKYRFIVDIVCDFRWRRTGEGTHNEIHKRNLVLRLWALDPDMIYRPSLDSESIRQRVNDPENPLTQRVMLRFHFDKATDDVSELRDHLQVGGVPDADTYCWLHPQIDVPRFPYAPIDLFLLCEFVGVSFYGREYSKIHQDPMWKCQIRRSQRDLLEEYYAGCLRAVRNEASVLVDHLWQGGCSTP